MNKPKKKLSKVVLNEVSFVGAGDNPEAHVVLLKTKVPEIVNKVCKAFVNKEMKTFNEILQENEVRETLYEYKWAWQDAFCSVIDDENIKDKQSAIVQITEEFLQALNDIKNKQEDSVTTEELQKQIEELQKQLDEKSAKVDEVTKELEALKKTEEKEEDIDKSALPEDVRKRMDEMEAVTKAALAEVALMKAEAIHKALVEKCATVEYVGKKEDLAEILKDLDSAKADAIFDVFKTINERLKTSNLFKEFGATAGVGEKTASEQLDKIADDIRKEDTTLTKEQALAKAYDKNPELVKQYYKEIKGA